MNTKGIVTIKADANGNGNLRFVSTKALEQELDGSESKFEEYFLQSITALTKKILVLKNEEFNYL